MVRFFWSIKHRFLIKSKNIEKKVVTNRFANTKIILIIINTLQQIVLCIKSISTVHILHNENKHIYKILINQENRERKKSYNEFCAGEHVFIVRKKKLKFATQY